MIAIAIGLSLAAAFFHVTWNVLVKVSADPIATFRRMTLMSAVAGTLLLALLWGFIGRPSLSIAAALLCLASATIETAYLWLLSAAYRRGELSAVYPIARGSAPLLAVVVGLTVLGETLTGPQRIGVALVLVGIVAVTGSQLSGRATVPALLTGVAIAAYSSIDRVGVRLATPWLYAWLLFTLMALELYVSIRLAGALRIYRFPQSAVPSWPRAALMGALQWSGYFLILLAFSIAPLAIVAPVREISVVAVAVWGVWRLHERGRAGLKLSGAAATLVGLALLAA
ncbi:MAG TPA: DMT family transporter [Candidatus Dormibacteraeota bacterium]|nr:DMT family transporter [Candidatus Dormibacteraeota bacterium]